MRKLKAKLKNAVYFAVYLIVRMLICVAQAAPLDLGVQVAKNFAWLFHTVLRLRQKVVDENPGG